MCTFYLSYIMESYSVGKENMYVARLNVNNKPLYVQVSWKNDDNDLFHIKVFNDDSSWVGKFTNELATKRREKLDETVEEYNTNVEVSLGGNSVDYVYDLTQSSDDVDTASFVWKKRYEGALQIHGIVPLKREELPTSKDTLINILLEQNKKLLSDIDIVNKANSDLKEELNQYTQKLEQFVESKTSLEQSLYGRFVQVLNEKKKRIQLLEDHINSL